MAKLTIRDVREYQKRMETVKANGFKAKDFKALGRELQNKFNLTVPQTTAVLNNRSDEILKILEEE
ncbi:hypothetical protein ACXATD_002492 [Clostridium sporogenes]|uniref:hypothetical protein n=1 Tax=Clostridium sporogenes TaxID=1509 RepID=UPI003F93045D